MHAPTQCNKSALCIILQLTASLGSISEILQILNVGQDIENWPKVNKRNGSHKYMLQRIE